MIDDDWRDYVEDLKKKLMHNGIVGDYYKSTDELEEEAKKLLSIVEVINNEIEIREKVQSELIWAKVISKIDAKVLNGETRVYERTATTGTAYRRLTNSVYNTSPPSLVSFVQATTSSSGGQRSTTPQQLEPVAEQQDEDDEQPQEANLQEVQQVQIVLQAHAVKDA